MSFVLPRLYDEEYLGAKWGKSVPIYLATAEELQKETGLKIPQTIGFTDNRSIFLIKDFVDKAPDKKNVIHSISVHELGHILGHPRNPSMRDNTLMACGFIMKAASKKDLLSSTQNDRRPGWKDFRKIVSGSAVSVYRSLTDHIVNGWGFMIDNTFTVRKVYCSFHQKDETWNNLIRLEPPSMKQHLLVSSFLKECINDPFTEQNARVMHSRLEKFMKGEHYEMVDNNCDLKPLMKFTDLSILPIKFPDDLYGWVLDDNDMRHVSLQYLQKLIAHMIACVKYYHIYHPNYFESRVLFETMTVLAFSISAGFGTSAVDNLENFLGSKRKVLENAMGKEKAKIVIQSYVKMIRDKLGAKAHRIGLTADEAKIEVLKVLKFYY